MNRHESACTLNPQRVCRMCKVNDEDATQRSVQELVAVLLVALPSARDGALDVELEQPVPDALFDAANGCPACLLAAVRQSGRAVEFDYAKAKKRMWSIVNDARAEEEGYY